MSDLHGYDYGYTIGTYKRERPDYDARWDFVDASKDGTLDEFKRGFEDGHFGRPRCDTYNDEVE